MELTAFQKTVIPSIISGDATTLETFIVAHCEHTRVQFANNLLMGFRNFQPNETAVLLANRAIAYGQIKEFLSLCKRLEAAGLIYTVTTVDRVAKFEPIVNPSARQNTQDPDYELITLVRQNATWEISATPELSEFVKNGYKTADEIDRQRTLEAAEKSQRTTNILAYATILVSIATAVGTTWFNYKTYTTDRTVIIKNTTAFPDTQKVLIVNPSAITSLGNPTNAPAVQPAK